jgi:DNA-binding HxlR family transcriptional regulator
MMMSKMCQKYEQASMLLGKRWIPMILYELLKGPKRFHDLEDELQISAKMLSDRLRFLEKENIVYRTVYPEMPIRVEYELTAKGKSLKPIIDALSAWSQTWF